MTDVTKESILDKITAMVNPRPIPVAARKTVKDINPESGKTYTSKDKIVLGIPDDMTITWAYPSFDFRTSSQIKILAKKAGMNNADLMAAIAMTWVADHQDEIDDLCGEILEEEKSIEEIQKEIDVALRFINRRRELIENLKK